MDKERYLPARKRSRSLTRRQFLGIATAAGVGAIAAACSQPATPQPAAPTSAGAPTAAAPSTAVPTVAAAPTTAQAPTAALAAVPTKPLNGETMRLLFVGDPFAQAMQKIADKMAEQAGGKIQLDILPYDGAHQKILLNAQQAQSAYDVVSVDIVWLGEYGSGKVLLPLNNYIAKTNIDVKDFPEAAWTEAQYKGQQMAIPIQPHPEILFYRKDLFEKDGIKPPETTDDLLAAAKHFNKPSSKFYGICWNGARGQPLGQQMAHFTAAFGQHLFDATWHPTLDTPKAVAAAEYAKALMAFSPPDILNMSWDERIRQFAQDGAAMTYEWAARSFLAEDPTSSKVAGKVGYTAAPHAPDAPPVVPNGEWTVAIPSNIGNRADLVWNFVAWLTSYPQLKELALAGNSGMPRYSIIRDPELVKKYPVFPAVDAMMGKGLLADWMRPAIPEWTQLCDFFGTIYNDMLAGSSTPAQAAQKMQASTDAMMKKDGYYK